MYAAARPLGVAPAVAVAIIQEAPKVLEGLAHLFGINTNGSYDETHAAILKYVQLILADPAHADPSFATPIPQTGGANWGYSAANALLGLRCWAGDQTVLALVKQLDPPTPANGFYSYGNGCGCETSHGCRRDAQQALAAVDQQLNRTNPSVSSAPIPSDPSSSTPSGTIVTTLPGGVTVGLPVPGSTVTTAQLYGIPVWAWLVGGVALASAFGGRRR